MNDDRIAEDAYSQTLSRLLDNPEAQKVAGSTINVVTLLRHTETWVVQTVRVEARETVFVQRINADGGMRLVLPPEVTAAIGRQHDTIATALRRRSARKAATTRKERGIKPAFLKSKQIG